MAKKACGFNEKPKGFIKNRLLNTLRGIAKSTVF